MASKEQKLPAQRMEHATTKLQDAMSALKLAVEELHIVDAEMIGSDANRRVTVEASKEDPIKVSDDIESHRMQAAEIASLAAEVAKPWVPPRTGSKRYQRRRAQRWPT